MTDNKASGSRTNRSRSRRAPVTIDQDPVPVSQEGVSEDKESETASLPDETIIPETLNNDFVKDTPLRPASRGMGLLVLAVLSGGIAGAAINLLMPIIYPVAYESNTRLTSIERSLVEGADIEAFKHTLDDLRRQNIAIGGRLSALEEQTLEAPAPASSATGQPQYVASEVTNAITALQANASRIDGVLAGIIEQLQKTGQIAPGLEVSHLQAEQEVLSRRLSDIAGSIAQVEIQAKKLPLLEGRLIEVEDELQAVERTTLTMEASNSERLVSLARLAVFERMHEALEEGKPFTAELEVLTRLGVSEASFSALQLAAKGIATPQSLAAQFVNAVSGIKDTSIPEDASLMDKLIARASQIVRVRRVDAEPSAADLAGQIKAFLLTNNASEALALWEGLPPLMRDKAHAVADALRLYVDAQEELANMTRSQIQVLGAQANSPEGK